MIWLGCYLSYKKLVLGSGELPLKQFQRKLSFVTCEQFSTSRLLKGYQGNRKKKKPPQGVNNVLSRLVSFTLSKLTQVRFLRSSSFKKCHFGSTAPTMLSTFRNQLRHMFNISIYLFYKPWSDIVNLLGVIDEIKVQKLNIYIQILIKTAKLYSFFLIKTILRVFKVHCDLVERA